MGLKIKRRDFCNNAFVEIIRRIQGDKIDLSGSIDLRRMVKAIQSELELFRQARAMIEKQSNDTASVEQQVLAALEEEVELGVPGKIAASRLKGVKVETAELDLLEPIIDFDK